MTDTKHPEATPQNLYQITGNVADMNTVLIERSELRRLQAENAELEAMLSSAPDAPPPPAAPQEPVAWMYEWNGRTHITTADQRPIEHAHPHFNKSKPLYTAPQPPVQQEPFGYFKAEPFGWTDCDKTDDGAVALYAAPQPARQPLTDEKLYALYCEAMKGYYVSALHYWRETEAHKFARAIEAAVNGSQQ